MSAGNSEPTEHPLHPLERLAADRARENELGQSENSVRMRSAVFGFLIGGLLGLFTGHIGLLSLEAHEEYLLTFYWTRELIAFEDHRPLIPTYFIGGSLVGALVGYQFFVLRPTFPSVRDWALGSIAFAIGTVFLIGYLASLMIVNFLDPITGPILDGQQLWFGIRFTLSLIGAIPSSLGVMGGAFYVAFVSTGIYLILWTGTKTALERTAHIRPLAGLIPIAAVIYLSAAALASTPYLISILGPDSITSKIVSLLSSLET